MTAAAHAVLARARVLGISLSLGRAADGSVCIIWGGPKGSMTAELRAEMVANKTDLVGHLKAERKAEIMAAFTAAYDRIGKTYPDANGAGLSEVANQLPDLFACVDNLESEADAAARAYIAGRGRLVAFASALAAWERGVLDAVASLASIRSGRLCTDCGSEAPVTLVTSLGQRVCSKCARTEGPVVRQAKVSRRLAP